VVVVVLVVVHRGARWLLVLVGGCVGGGIGWWLYWLVFVLVGAWCMVHGAWCMVVVVVVVVVERFRACS